MPECLPRSPPGEISAQSWTQEGNFRKNLSLPLFLQQDKNNPVGLLYRVVRVTEKMSVKNFQHEKRAIKGSHIFFHLPLLPYMRLPDRLWGPGLPITIETEPGVECR